jgi:hypothetical protein
MEDSSVKKLYKLKTNSIKKMKENKLRLIDKIYEENNDQWVDIFGNKRPNYWTIYPNGHIYIIKNTFTKFSYIGETNNLVQRKSFHASNLKNFSHINYDMQIDSILYGIDKFLFGILEFNVSDDQLLERERYWIKRYKTEYPLGYNVPYNKKERLENVISKEFMEHFKRVEEERILFVREKRNK